MVGEFVATVQAARVKRPRIPYILIFQPRLTTFPLPDSFFVEFKAPGNGALGTYKL